MKVHMTALLLTAIALLCSGCTSDRTSGEKAALAAGNSPGEAQAMKAIPATEPKGTVAKGHDPAHPPIDCPLRRQGLDPNHLRPFEDVENYIAFLERADRAAWQKPDEVVAALGLEGSETVFDLGAGSGYFSFRLAQALPLGKVIAADTEPEMVRHIHHKAMSERQRNLEAELIQPGDPGVSADADLVFICDVLHHVQEREAWMSRVAKQMKPGARLALIEFKEGELPEGPPESVKIGRASMLELVAGAGLRLESEHPDLLPYQTFMVFRKGAR